MDRIWGKFFKVQLSYIRSSEVLVVPQLLTLMASVIGLSLWSRCIELLAVDDISVVMSLTSDLPEIKDIHGEDKLSLVVGWYSEGSI